MLKVPHTSRSRFLVRLSLLPWLEYDVRAVSQTRRQQRRRVYDVVFWISAALNSTSDGVYLVQWVEGFPERSSDLVFPAPQTSRLSKYVKCPTGCPTGVCRSGASETATGWTGLQPRHSPDVSLNPFTKSHGLNPVLKLSRFSETEPHLGVGVSLFAGSRHGLVRQPPQLHGSDHTEWTQVFPRTHLSRSVLRSSDARNIVFLLCWKRWIHITQPKYMSFPVYIENSIDMFRPVLHWTRLWLQLVSNYFSDSI